MALKKGINSYATVEEANAYFINRLDVAAWAAANDTLKSQALITATSVLDNLEWIGIIESESQTLAFPRVGEYFDPRLGYNKTISGIPDRIIKAVFEEAFHLLNNEGLLDETGSVIDLQISSISLNRIKNPSKLSSTVKVLIQPLLLSQGSNTWWRAN